MADSFHDLLQQIAGEHHRILSRLRAENEELRARLARWESTDASGIQGRETGQLRQDGHGPGQNELSLLERSRPRPEGAPATLTRQDMDDRPRPSLPRADMDHGEGAETFRSPSQPRDQQLQAATRMARAQSVLTFPSIFDEAEPLQNVPTPGLRGKVQRLILNDSFELVVAGIIVLNTASMAVELQYNGIDAGYRVGYRGVMQPAAEAWPGVENVFPVVEKCFTVIYCFELALRIFGTGPAYFISLLNWVDITVVSISVLDWIFEVLASDDSLDVPIIKLMRLLRLLKGVRILTRFRSALALLVMSIYATWSTLFWSLFLIEVIQAISAMFMVQLISEYINDSTAPEIERQEIYKYWGTFSLAFITMFEITLANWSPPCRALVKNVSEGYFFFFLLYRCIIGMAVLSVINAVFIQKTLKQAQNDHDETIARKQHEIEEQRQKLGVLFRHLDTSGDGRIGWDEFRSALQDPMTTAWLETLELHINDLEALFKMVDDGDGSIEIDEFIKSMPKLKGPAKSFDMMHVLALCKSFHRRTAIPNTVSPACSLRFEIAEVQSLGENDRTILDIPGSALPESRSRAGVDTGRKPAVANVATTV